MLYGDLGTGKSTIARALIQSLDASITEVPSPTFTLMLPYTVDINGECVECVHADLYRLEDISEVYELGLIEMVGVQPLIIEWPERLADNMPADYISVHLNVAPNNAGRIVTLEFHGTFFHSYVQVIDAIHRAFPGKFHATPR